MTAAWEHDVTALVSERGRALVGYAYVLCGDLREAEDLVQEAVVRIFSRLRKPPAIPAPATAGVDVQVVPAQDRPLTYTEAYVRRTVLNLYLDDYRRRRKWFELKPLVASADSERSPESGAAVRADVAHALTRLSRRQRVCITLRYFDDLTVPQIAEVLGTAPGTVKRHLHDALAQLRGVLDPGQSGAYASIFPEGGPR